MLSTLVELSFAFLGIRRFALLRQESLWLATGRNGVFGFAGFRKDALRLAAECFTC